MLHIYRCSSLPFEDNTTPRTVATSVPEAARSKLQGVDPYTYLVDVLQRVGEHPAARVIELAPRVWKTLFADNPLRSDLDGARDPPPH